MAGTGLEAVAVRGDTPFQVMDGQGEGLEAREIRVSLVSGVDEGRYSSSSLCPL